MQIPKISLSDIEQSFKDTIKIPEVVLKPQFFVCPVGLVGSGKTTVVGPIAERFDMIRVSSDELRKLLKEGGYDYSPVKEINFRIIKEFISKGYRIVFDMDCGSPQVKSFAEEIARELNIKIFFLHITAPEEFIFEKFRKHPPTWLADNPQTMIDNHLAQKETREKEDTQFDYFYTFDTSKSDLPQQIEDCCKKIKVNLAS